MTIILVAMGNRLWLPNQDQDRVGFCLVHKTLWKSLVWNNIKASSVLKYPHLIQEKWRCGNIYRHRIHNTALSQEFIIHLIHYFETKTFNDIL